MLKAKPAIKNIRYNRDSLSLVHNRRYRRNKQHLKRKTATKKYHKYSRTAQVLVPYCCSKTFWNIRILKFSLLLTTFGVSFNW
jgi:hypothetical protein